jgi:dTDP-4-dehydrorhamnose 3,5-epimerase
MSRFTVTHAPLPGLCVVERQTIVDARGSFVRLFCSEELASTGWTQPVAQINHAYTRGLGTVRGLHYQQAPHAEMKLVSCVRGEVWDVAVDLRPNSPSYLKWHAERLSADNQRAFLIPQGFAHGFQVQTAEAELLYCHSAPYVSGSDRGLNPLDPRLAVSWPLPVVNLSDKDRTRPLLEDLGADFQGVDL